jgi:hypothetical protein
MFFENFFQFRGVHAFSLCVVVIMARRIWIPPGKHPATRGRDRYTKPEK